jgi:hypothetical protein
MKRQIIFRVFIMAFIIGLFLPSNHDAAAGLAVTIRYVAPGGNNSGSCTNKSLPCKTIQYAVDKSAAGDEIHLAGSAYKATSTPLVNISKGITLRGGYSIANWNVSDKTTNPTKLSVPCAWDAGEAAIEVVTSGSVTIQDLDIDGCGIRSSSALLVERVSITDGMIDQAAPANTPLTLRNMIIQNGGVNHASATNSVATLDHVKIFNSPTDGISEVSGGGLVLSDSQIVGCSGAGIYFANAAFPSSVTRTGLEENGLGIKTKSAGTLTLNQVIIKNNQGRGVLNKGAGMVMNQVTIQGNQAVRNDTENDPGDGGGYYTSGMGSTLTDVVIEENSADGMGGGIFDKSGGVTLVRSLIASNQAGSSGGGIWSQGNLIVNDSAITGNQASPGGGIHCDACLLNMTNSAISANATAGLVSISAKIRSTNSLVVGNSGPGIDVTPGSQPAPLFDNTIFASNGGGNCPTTIVLSGDHNLSSDAACHFTGAANWSQTDPKLGGLLTNGFYSLSSSSPAIDEGDPSTCPTKDYRGFHRPVDGNLDGIAVCDIGPLEVGQKLLFLPLIVR